MKRLPITERPDWREKATEFGFNFHTMYGEPYWCEDAYYQFTLAQIEEIEDATADIHQMCLKVVERVVGDDALMTKFQHPETHVWEFVRSSWRTHQPSLYSRLDWPTTASTRLSCWKTTPIRQLRCMKRPSSNGCGLKIRSMRATLAAGIRSVQQFAGKAHRAFRRSEKRSTAFRCCTSPVVRTQKKIAAPCNICKIARWKPACRASSCISKRLAWANAASLPILRIGSFNLFKLVSVGVHVARDLRHQAGRCRCTLAGTGMEKHHSLEQSPAADAVGNVPGSPKSAGGLLRRRRAPGA
jgi:hypothetical protein